MKHKLKTLLVTSVLSTASVFGADAWQGDSSETTKVRDLVFKKGNEHGTVASTQSKMNSDLHGSNELKKIEELHKSLLSKGLLTMDIHSCGYSVSQVAMKMFKAVFTQGLERKNNENILDVLSAFSGYMKSLNMPQLTRKETVTTYVVPKEIETRKVLEKAANRNDHETLIQYARNGSKEAQRYVAKGYANGWFGFEKNPSILVWLANQEWSAAQEYVAYGYALGNNLFEQNINYLMQVANNGWPVAQKLVVDGLANNMYGLTNNPMALWNLANNGWTYAQEFVVKGVAHGWYGFDQDYYQLNNLAFLGWPGAQRLLIEAYTADTYNLNHHQSELLQFAYMGWPDAQKFVALGFANGSYGFKRNPINLLEAAKLGWAYAQKYVIEGFANGLYGLPKDPRLSKFFEIYFELKNDNRL